MQSKVGVIFDMDGTLFDSSSVVPDSFIATLAEYGVNLSTREEIINCYHMGPPRVLFSHFLGRPAEDAVLDAYHRNLAQQAKHVKIYDGILELLETLRPQVHLGVYTGASCGAAQILLNASGLLPYFEVVVGGDEVEYPKPDPGGLFKAFTALSLSPKDGFYIGDSPDDLEAARRAQAQPIGAGWGHLFEVKDGEVAASHPLEILGMVI